MAPAQPVTAPQEKPRRGRPPTGRALSSTERNKLRRERLAAEGWRKLGSVMLTPAAAAALDQLTAGGTATIDQAVAEALEALARQRLHP